MRQALVGGQQVPQAQKLFQNLAAGQVASYAIQTTGAEDTAHAAAHLGADAGRASRVFLDKDALDEFAVLEAEKQLVRAVGCLQVPANARSERRKLRRQGGAEVARQIGHLLERLRSAGDEPAADLPGAQRRLAVLMQPGQKLFARHVEYGAH